MAEKCEGIDDEAACSCCNLRHRLSCQIEPDQVRLFVASQGPYLALAIFSLIFVGAAAGTWWPLLAFAAAGLAFLGPVEMRFLCSHCPHYAREGRWLKCMAPNPFPKLWSPRPWPMRSHEKMIIVAFAGFILLFPALTLAGAIRFLLGQPALLAAAVLEGALLISAIQFYYLLTRCFCSRCVNLSCPFNRVPGTTAQQYLKMNLTMREAGKK